MFQVTILCKLGCSPFQYRKAQISYGTTFTLTNFKEKKSLEQGCSFLISKDNFSFGKMNVFDSDYFFLVIFYLGFYILLVVLRHSVFSAT